MSNIAKFNDPVAFVQFLDSKGNATYDYFDHANCVFAQWFKECMEDAVDRGTVCAGGDNIRYYDTSIQRWSLIKIPSKFEMAREFARTFLNEEPDVRSFATFKQAMMSMYGIVA